MVLLFVVDDDGDGDDGDGDVGDSDGDDVDAGEDDDFLKGILSLKLED